MDRTAAILVIGALLAGCLLGACLCANQVAVVRDRERNARAKDGIRCYEETIYTINRIHDAIRKPCTN